MYKGIGGLFPNIFDSNITSSNNGSPGYISTPSSPCHAKRPEFARQLRIRVNYDPDGWKRKKGDSSLFWSCENSAGQIGINACASPMYYYLIYKKGPYLELSSCDKLQISKVSNFSFDHFTHCLLRSLFP